MEMMRIQPLAPNPGPFQVWRLYSHRRSHFLAADAKGSDSQRDSKEIKDDESDALTTALVITRAPKSLTATWPHNSAIHRMARDDWRPTPRRSKVTNCCLPKDRQNEKLPNERARRTTKGTVVLPAAAQTRPRISEPG